MKDADKEIIIIGSGINGSLLSRIEAKAKEVEKKVIVVDNVCQFLSDPYIIHAPRIIEEHKPKVNCKKGHTYTNGICRCGREYGSKII